MYLLSFFLGQKKNYILRHPLDNGESSRHQELDKLVSTWLLLTRGPNGESTRII